MQTDSLWEHLDQLKILKTFLSYKPSGDLMRAKETQMTEGHGPSPRVHPRTSAVHGPRLKTLELNSLQKVWFREG